MNAESIALIQQLLANGGVPPFNGMPDQYLAWLQSFNFRPIGDHSTASSVPTNSAGTQEIRRFLEARASSNEQANRPQMGGPNASRPMPPPTPVNPMVQNVFSHQDMIGRVLYRSQEPSPQMNGQQGRAHGGNQLHLSANGSIPQPVPIPRPSPAPTGMACPPIPNNNLFNTPQNMGAFQVVQGRVPTTAGSQNGRNHLGHPPIAPPAASNGGEGVTAHCGAPNPPENAHPRQPRILEPCDQAIAAFEEWKRSGKLSFIMEDGSLQFKVAGDKGDEDVLMSRNHFLTVLKDCVTSNPTIFLQYVGEALKDLCKKHPLRPNFLEDLMGQLNQYRELLTNQPIGRIELQVLKELVMDPPPTLQDERSGPAQRNESADSGEAPILVVNAIQPAMEQSSSSLQAAIHDDAPSCSFLPQQNHSMVKDDAGEKPKRGSEEEDDASPPQLKKMKLN